MAGGARAAEEEDIEEVPKALKRHSKRAQQHMAALLPTETPPHSPLAHTLYRAHVRATPRHCSHSRAAHPRR